MLPKEFIEMCKSRDWDRMISFLKSDITLDGYDMVSPRVLITGLIEAYHPNKSIKYTLGLSIWLNQLNNSALNPCLTLANTNNLAIASVMAEYGCEGGFALQDVVVSSLIRDFENKNWHLFLTRMVTNQLQTYLNLEKTSCKFNSTYMRPCFVFDASIDVNTLKNYVHILRLKAGMPAEVLPMQTLPFLRGISIDLSLQEIFEILEKQLNHNNVSKKKNIEQNIYKSVFKLSLFNQNNVESSTFMEASVLRK